VRVEVLRSPLAGEPVEGALVDVSRHGFRVQIPAAVSPNDALHVCVRDTRSGMDLMLRGTVRWVQEEDDGTWSAGCLAIEPLSWETLGELFLNGILTPPAEDAEPVAQKPT